MNGLGTKADTLQILYQKLKYAEVLPQLSFSVGQWEYERTKVLDKICKEKWSHLVIIRSSSLSEDTQKSSGAGKYESVSNVSGSTKLEKAIEAVISSYDDNNEENQVLVQPMLTKVKLCGVAFTADPNTCGNYFVVNYDMTGTTDAITSGNVKENRLYYHFKEVEDSKAPPEMQKIISSLRELEEFFCDNSLDVEFAITDDDTLYILQVRSLCLREKLADQRSQYEELKRIKGKIIRDQSPKPFLCGKKTIYGVMTDWNPAEMIGIRPKPLAKSLYREVITDSVWAYQRDNYGYRNLRSFPLMVDFGGLSYIDIRVSFNSFIPAGLDEVISEKLVNYYLERLIEKPEKHDKAEFDIVFSCYTLDLPERIKVLEKYGFSKEEVEKILHALREVTNNIIDHDKGLWRRDYEKIDILSKRYDEIITSDISEIEKIYWLLEDCKRYGTLPFAGLARAAFIAVQILQSFVNCGIMTKHDYELFMSGIHTVSSNMNNDFEEMSKQTFIKKYGHLRPGTYDICSMRYDEAPELYFDWGKKEAEKIAPKEVFRLSLDQLNEIKRKQLENGLTNDILDLMDFIRSVIEGREYGKFVFTRSISKMIQMIGEMGASANFSKEECAYIDIQTIRNLYSTTQDVHSCFRRLVEKGKEEYEMTKTLTLPPLIVDPGDVMRFFYPDSEPNFITSNKIEGAVCLVDQGVKGKDLEGKILLISSADPGYDWIFSENIKGFITMYGGANSHMAIRAGELGIPAVVGVGAKDFELYKRARRIEIDTLGKLVRIIR